mmetsp:Transcript_11308/g.19035  ORF Transcript_11308/g.19035 Transcript_11308/m.19035 type:complete len:208 (+) Transcript_11308:313-936(+)
MINKIPEKIINPYRQMNHSYFDDYDMDGNEKKDEEKIDPEIEKELNDNEAILPDNSIFEGALDKEKVEEGPKKPRLVALKKQKNILDLNGLNYSLLREIKLLQELNHPNIVKLYDVFHLKGLLFFALEYGRVDFGDLIFSEKAKSDILLEPQHIKNLMRQVLEGLGYLHSNWIMHRDLKPGNMVVNDEGIVKLIDFNSAKIYGSPKH